VYLNDDCQEKLWTVAGSEFGSEKGTVIIITRALYSLNSSRAAWREKLAETMRTMEYMTNNPIQMYGLKEL
jgi:hypothetical protein